MWSTALSKLKQRWRKWKFFQFNSVVKATAKFLNMTGLSWEKVEADLKQGEGCLDGVRPSKCSFCLLMWRTSWLTKVHVCPWISTLKMSIICLHIYVFFVIIFVLFFYYCFLLSVPTCAHTIYGINTEKRFKFVKMLLFCFFWVWILLFFMTFFQFVEKSVGCAVLR